MQRVVISGTGLYTPSDSISNEELVSSFNAYVSDFNQKNSEAIASGLVNALVESNSDFIKKASGIDSRYVVEKKGILDPCRMKPDLTKRSNDQLSLLAEMGLLAAKEALITAKKTASDIDGVIVACSNLPRAYPAISIEIQSALQINGFAFDMNVACSSATFGLQMALGQIQSNQARSILVISPEVCTGHLDFHDRDSHFIFGDAATAVVVERDDVAKSSSQLEIMSSKLITSYSNNIRNNFGFLNRLEADKSQTNPIKNDKLFVQEGRKVFKEVCPMVVEFIGQHLAENELYPADMSRFWLHQANLNMNLLIIRKLLGRDATIEEAPIVLDRYANTSSAGSIIALHKYQDNLLPGNIGVLCSFGAGYSIGSLILRKYV